MAAGADSIDDMDLLRHGAMTSLFGGVRAPSTLGSHLRCYTWGNVSQLEKAGREFLAALARRAPLLPGADVLAFIDIDSMQKRVYGHKKQGARFGHTKIQGKSLLVRGLNALAATISTPLAAPVIAATRLRGGNAASARGAASLAAQAIGTARDCRLHRDDRGPAGLGVLRRRGDRRDPPRRGPVLRHRPGERQHPRRDRRHPRGRLDRRSSTRSAIWDDQLGAGSPTPRSPRRSTRRSRRRKARHVTARLIVRRVRDLNKQAAAGQDELFPAWRYHAVFTDSPFELVQAEEQHRDHAVVEQVLADVTSGPLAHLPSGVVHRERGLAVDRGHGAQPAPRRRGPGRACRSRRPAPRPSAAT